MTSWLTRPGVRLCLVAFLVGRVVVSVLAAVGWQLPHEQPEPATHWAAQPPGHAWEAAFTGLEHYDAEWYLQIARDGYRNGDPSSAYFPLYPLLVRGVGLLLGSHWLLAATLVSNVAFLGALLLLYRLTERELGERTARWSVVLLVLNPFVLFFYAPYTESLFLLLTLACLMWLRSEHWARAAGAAAAASATRSTGIVLGAVIAATALSEVGWWPRGRDAWRRLARTLPWAASAGVGMAAYLAYWQTRTSWHEPLDVQRTAFQRQPEWPWTSLVDGVRIMADTLKYPGWLITNLEVLLTVVMLGLAVVALRRYAPPYQALVATSVVVPLCLVRPFSPLVSVPRYYVVVFPLFWALAQTTERPRVRAAVITVSSLLLVLLTLLFASWHDVL